MKLSLQVISDLFHSKTSQMLVHSGTLFAVLLASFSVSSTFAVDNAQRQQDLVTKIQPLLKKHCLECHSGAEPEAGLTLDHFGSPKDFLKGQVVWRKAVQKMQIGEMPPPDSTKMTEAERSFLTSWITSTIEDFECGLTPNPGQVTLRRLNANEYRNTIRDLVQIDYKPAAGFPADDVGYGFDNIGDVLTLPPLLMEKYVLAAEEISQQAIMTPPGDKRFEATYLGDKLQTRDGKTRANDREVVISSGDNKNGTMDVVVKEQIPWAGLFQLTVSAAGDQAGNEPVKMMVLLDGKPVREVAVRNLPDKPQDYPFPLRLRPGSREIAVRFTNDFYVEKQGDTPAQDRNLRIQSVSLIGTQASTVKLDPEKLPASHKAIVFTEPKTDADAPRATKAVLERLASRAFRRPVDPADLKGLTDLALSVQADGESFEGSLQVALQAILISPKFLFRVEPPKGIGTNTTGLEKYRKLDDFELATRLSYFLWSSMPDEKLLALAWTKQLSKPDVLSQQIQRMIMDLRANAFVDNFAGQWLTLRKLDSFEPDPKLFPRWNDKVKQLARRETLTFFAGVMREDTSVVRLLDADFTYLNEPLAEYYNIGGVRGEGFRKVSLAGTPRSGLLTHASVLAVTSNPTRTSPVKRGKWILDNLLATPPPPAPPGVPELKEKGQLVGTLRQRMEQHRTDPACASCHKLMDPLGFALENFDAVGAYRTKEDNLPVNASGVLPNGKTVNGAEELRKALMASNQQQFIRCLTEKMLTYALGRGLEYYDKCAVDKIVAEMEKHDNKFSVLLQQIVLSDPFQKKGEREIE